MNYRQSIFILLPVCLLLQCDLINPDESVPAFILINPFELQTDPGVQGSASHKITEGWLTVNGEFLGAYQLPATVPVLMEGPADVVVEAGIKDNGISTTPDIYPFYSPYETSVTLIPDETATVNPKVSYDRNTKFSFIEDFESGATLFQDLLQGQTGLTVSDEDVFEGSYSGRIELTDTDPVVEVATLNEYPGLTDQSPYVYLEVNYRSEAPVIFGLIGGRGTSSRNSVYDPGFNPKETWNKIYFNLSGLLATSPFDAHQIGLQAYLPTENGQFTTSQATVWLDNIKLVHF
ncbi:MAG: hypothetical protein R2824_08500 [Saprospiraceae bacterium]